VFLGRSDIIPLAWPFRCDRHELRTHSISLALFADVAQRNGCAADQAYRAGSAYRTVAWYPLRAADLEPDALFFPHRDRDDVTLLAFLLTKPERFHQRHRPCTGWVGAGHGPRPDPSDDRAIYTFDINLRVQMADAFLGLVAHPLSVAAHVLGQTRCAGPGQPFRDGTRKHWSVARPLRRDLDQRLVNQYRDRVQVGCMRLKPEPLCLKRDGPAAGERVEDRRGVAAGRPQDLLVRFPEQLLIVDFLPDHKP
jgi:hypothetical protein